MKTIKAGGQAPETATGSEKRRCDTREWLAADYSLKFAHDGARPITYHSEGDTHDDSFLFVAPAQSVSGFNTSTIVKRVKTGARRR